MNFLISGLLIALTSIVNGHLHTNEKNPQWKINLRSELESKMQTMFTNFSKQYELIKNQQLKLFLDSLGTDIKNTVKIQVDNDHDHEHEDSHDHEHDHSHQESPSINVNCLRTKLDEIFNFVKSNDDNKTNFNSSRFLNSCPYFAHGMASCFSQKITHKIEYKSVVSAFVSAIVITIIGILCYLVVPSIESEKFKYFFQFLVALAVGTLSGDSLLHLIPHAFIDHDHDHKEHVHDSADVYKGLAAVAGIYIFFLIEKVMMIRRARKEKQHKEIEKNNDDNLEVATSSDKTAADQSYYMLHANKDLKYIAQYLPNNPCNVDIEHHDSENEVKHFHKHALSTDASNLATASSHGSYCSSDTE
ncbi:zinc transporter ZIP10-like isoform X1, partial [Brachionus plicatilis]